MTIAADVQPLVLHDALPIYASEAGLDPATFTISRTGCTNSALTVNYTRGGTATPGADYLTNSVSGTAVIAAGAQSSTLKVTPNDDAGLERDETVVVALSSNAA